MLKNKADISFRVSTNTVQDALMQARHHLDIFIHNQKVAKFKRENIPPQHWRD